MLPKLNLSQRIAAGYFFTVIITFCFGIFTLVNVSDNRKGYLELTEVLIPSNEQLKGLQFLIKESNTAALKIVCDPEETETASLEKIHNETYPALRTRLKLIYTKFNLSKILRQIL